MKRRLKRHRPRRPRSPIAWRELANQAFWAVCLSLVIAVLGGGGWAVYTHVAGSGSIDVRDIEIVGAKRVGPELASYLQIHPGTPLTAVDTRLLRARLERHPWVRTASVEKRWPDRLRVHLDERRPALLHLARGFYVVDDEGQWVKRLEAGDELDLPVVTGVAPRPVTEAAARLRALSRFVAYWDAHESPIAVGEVHYMGTPEVWVYPLSGGPRLLLPLDESRWPEVRTRLEAVLREAKRIGVKLESIDLLYPEKVIAQRKT